MAYASNVLATRPHGRWDTASMCSATPTLGPTSRAWIAYGVGEVLSLEGRIEEAIASYADAIELGRSVGSRFVVGVSEVSRLAALVRGGETAEASATLAPVLRRHRDLDHDTHATTALRNVVWLLVRTERDDTAMRVLGALESHSTSETYGIESELLSEAKTAAARRHGTEQADAWMAEGHDQPVRWALDQALDSLADTTQE